MNALKVTAPAAWASCMDRNYFSPWEFGRVTESTLNMVSGEQSEPVSAGFHVTARGLDGLTGSRKFGGSRIVDKGLSESDAQRLCGAFNALLAEHGTLLAALKRLLNAPDLCLESLEDETMRAMVAAEDAIRNTEGR